MNTTMYNNVNRSRFYSLANCLATASRSSGSVRMYEVKADDFHLSSAWIKESLRPAFAAVVAAPILKL